MTGSPSRLSDPIDARELLVMRCSFPFLTSRMTSTSAPESCDVADLADLDAGDAHDGAALEALHVRKLRLELVALPGKPGGAADGDDDHRRQDHGRDSDDADLQFGPGERACSRHKLSS